MFVVATLLAVRYAIVRGFELGSYERYFDKWHLGIVRVIDFVAVALLLIRAHSHLKLLSIRPLVLLGRSSLQVFCTHLFFCFAGLTLLGNASMLSGWKQFGLVAATLLGMLLTAKLFSKPEPDDTAPTLNRPLPLTRISHSPRLRQGENASPAYPSPRRVVTLSASGFTTRDEATGARSRLRTGEGHTATPAECGFERPDH